LWAEVRWAARAEAVAHLDDLLLRRVRLGLLLPEGGRRHLARIRAIAQPELGWDDAGWAREVEAYLALWDQACRPAGALPARTPNRESPRAA
jgi:glycerol-3-phosphate dehydrogenase